MGKKATDEPPKRRGRPPGSKNKPKPAAEPPKRRGRPPGSTNKPKAEAAPAEAPKRRGRPPGGGKKPAEPGNVVVPRRRGRPPGSGKKPAQPSAGAKAQARASSKKKAPPPAEPAQAPVAPPPPMGVAPQTDIVVGGEPRETVVATMADLRVDVEAPERRVLIRVRGDLYQRLVLLTKAQNAHFPADERLEVAEQASLCLEAGLTVCEADPTLTGVLPSTEPLEDAEYQSALSQACTGRLGGGGG